jgi:hypothetical protein
MVVAEVAPILAQLAPGISSRRRVCRPVCLAQLAAIPADLSPIAVDLAPFSAQLAPIPPDVPAVSANLPPIAAQLLDVGAAFLRRRHRAEQPHRDARGQDREDPSDPPRPACHPVSS